jgi:hypothetical protein
MPAIAGFVILVQLVAGAVVVALARWPWAGWAVLVGYVGFLVHACRHGELLAGLGSWHQRLAASLLWQGPALVFGVWNLGGFLGWWSGFDVGCAVLQAWHAVFLPLGDLIPRGEWRLVSWYLWAMSAWPLVLVAALVGGSRRGVR